MTVLVTLPLVAAACSDDEAASSTTPAATSAAGDSRVGYVESPCPSPNFPGVRRLELGATFTCGTLTVPEVRSDPDSRLITIQVAVAKAHAPVPKPDPIVYLAGGPGWSAMVPARERVFRGWNRNRDVVFVDQRGTYHAEPRLSCPEIDEFALESLTFATMSAEASVKSAEAIKACRDRLAGDGWHLAAYNSLENAADIADLRVALGYDEWNVYGVSYGSELALQLLRDHPEGIRSVVVDSAVPPQRDLLSSFWQSAAEGYQALFDACAAQPKCAAAYPDLEEEFTRLINELAITPRTVHVPNPADGGDVAVVVDAYALATMVVAAAATPRQIAPLPAMIDDLATGDGKRIARAMVASVLPADFFGYGLNLGVFCGEVLPATTPEQLRESAVAVLPEFPADVLARPPQSGNLASDCEAWDVPPVGPPVHEPAISDVPVLVLAGALDAITAPSAADLAASTLENSTVVRFPDSGHDVTAWSPACALFVMSNFLEAPGGDFDRTCIDRLEPAAFTIT